MLKTIMTSCNQGLLSMEGALVFSPKGEINHSHKKMRIEITPVKESVQSVEKEKEIGAEKKKKKKAEREVSEKKGKEAVEPLDDSSKKKEKKKK